VDHQARPGGVVDSVQETFIKITTGLDYPMLVVTARADSRLAGCLVGFSTQCSVNPPRYLVCLSDKNRTQRVASGADVLAVHFLSAHAKDVARLFGEETTDEDDTFSRCRWHPGPSGVPILDDCGRWFAGTIVHRQPLGDHVGFLLEPIAAHYAGPEDDLFFHQVKDLDPGHEP
jgi:flavin reductase (DIM6/NTAB) family NADH-FMN oxidoreductase RutF